WAFYEGVKDGIPYAIHYTSGCDKGKEEVRSEPLMEMAGLIYARKNNGWDEKWIPLPQDEILRRAKEEGKNTDFTSNEHFALSCRYGEKWGEPVKAPKTLKYYVETAGDGVIVVFMVPVAFVFFSSLYWAGRLSEKIKNFRESEDSPGKP
ncbi:hypothetical protein PENTCL1PPCAC_1917, partial [Pristionchus entomophagus]